MLMDHFLVQAGGFAVRDDGCTEEEVCPKAEVDVTGVIFTITGNGIRVPEAVDGITRWRRQVSDVTR